MQQGVGKLAIEDGSFYEGDLYGSQPSGYRKHYYTDSKKGYEGHWLDGEYHGQGKLKGPDGSSLEGTFENGLLQGAVTLTDSSGKSRTVMFRDGVQEETR